MQYSRPQPDTWREVMTRCAELQGMLPDIGSDIVKLQGNFRDLEKSVELLLRIAGDIANEEIKKESDGYQQ